MSEKEATTLFWVPRDALSRGITVTQAYDDDASFPSDRQLGKTVFYSQSVALSRANTMRRLRIAQLKEQIARLRAIDFLATMHYEVGEEVMPETKHDSKILQFTDCTFGQIQKAARNAGLAGLGKDISNAVKAGSPTATQRRLLLTTLNGQGYNRIDTTSLDFIIPLK